MKELVVLSFSRKSFKLFYCIPAPQMMNVHVLTLPFVPSFNHLISAKELALERSEDNFLRCLNETVAVSLTAFCSSLFCL